MIALILSLLAQGDIPETPEKLQFKPLTFDVPDAGKMRVVLSNGAVAYVVEDRSLPKVEIALHMRAGSFWEEAGREGVAGACGTLMRTGGTKTRTPQQLDEDLDFLAADLGVGIGDTTGRAALSILSKDLDRGLELFFDVLRNPGFAQEKLDLWKAQTMEGLKARNDRTESIEAREANRLLYGEHPVNRHATGASVQAITREDLGRVHQRFVHPGNFVIAAAGDFSRDALIAKLEKAMGGWTSGEKTPAVPKVAHTPKPGVYCFHKDDPSLNQGRVTMGHLGIDLHHPDGFALRVLSYIFGAGGFSSRLMQKVRTDMGLAYDVRSDFRPGIAFQGTMRILFQSKSETCALAARTCLEELEKVRRDSVTEEELAGARQFYLDAFPGLFFSTPAQTANTFAQAELNGYPKGYYETYREKISAVTREDIKRVANEHLHPAKLVIVVAGNIPVIRAGDASAKLADLGRPIEDVPLPDPVTLVRAVEATPRKVTGRLCAACKDKAFTADIGICTACLGTTESGAFKLCGKCAGEKGLCMACGVKR